MLTEEEKKEVAVFRFGIICELIIRSNMSYGEKERIIKKAKQVIEQNLSTETYRTTPGQCPGFFGFICLFPTERPG